LVCALNGSTEHALALDARARGFFPKLRVGADDAFVFKPTCVGAVAARDVDVTNVSRINVLYEWSIPEKLSDVLSVSPAGGMIRGGETVPSHWTFCPRKIKRLGFKVALNLRVPNSYEKNDRARLPGAPSRDRRGGSRRRRGRARGARARLRDGGRARAAPSRSAPSRSTSGTPSWTTPRLGRSSW
jgi:hypothetical protein